MSGERKHHASAFNAQGESLKHLAVVATLAPVRADKFRALSDADAKKVELSKVESGSAVTNFQGVRDSLARTVFEFRPRGRVLRAVVCTEVSRAQMKIAATLTQPP
jgi:hypothetical protein